MRGRFNWRLFGGFLLLGLLSGTFFGSLSASAAPSEKPARLQQNFLIALVDEAQAESSTLESLWLAVVHSETGMVSWMPVYPQPFTSESGSYTRAHEAIEVRPADLDAWQGFELLRKEGLLWDEIILLDRLAIELLGDLIDFQGAVEPVSTAREPQSALHQQVIFIQNFCENSGKLAADAALDELLLLRAAPTHLRSSLSTFEFIALWDQFAKNGFALTCNHPWAD